MEFKAEYNEDDNKLITVKLRIKKDFLYSRKHALEYIDKIREFVRGL